MGIGERFSLFSVISFRTLVASAVAILAFLVAVGIAFSALSWVRTGLRNVLEKQQRALLTLSADAIDRQISGRQRILQGVSKDLPKEESREVIQEFLLQQSGLARHFDQIHVINSRLELVTSLYSPSKSAKPVFVSHRFIRDTLASGRERVGVASSDEPGGQPMIMLTMPVIGPSRQVALVVVASIDLSRINLPDQLYQLRTGQTGYAYMSAEDGTILAHSNPQHIIKTVSDRHSVQAPILRIASDPAAMTHAGEFSDAQHLVITKKLQSGNWSLTSVLPESEIFASIAQAEAMIPAAAVVLAGLSGLLIWWLIHLRITPLQNGYRRLQQQGSAVQHASLPTLADAEVIDSTAADQVTDQLSRPVNAFLSEASPHRHHAEELRNNPAFLQSLIDYLPVLVFVKSLRPESHDQLVVWNKAAEVITGYDAAQVIGKTNREIFPPEMASSLEQFDRAMLADPKVSILPEVPYRRPDGERRFFRAVSVPLMGEGNRLDYVLGIIEDITDRRRQEQELRTRQAELAAVNDASPLGLFCSDLKGRCSYANRTMEAMAGVALQRMLGTRWRRCIHREDRFRILLELHSWEQHHGEPYTGICRLRHGDGKLVWVGLKAVPVMVDGKANGYVGSVEDITARRVGELALLKSEQRLRLITDNIPALVAYVTPDERVAFANRRYEEAYGILHEELFGMHARDVLGPEVYAQSRQYIREALGGQTAHFEREVWRDNALRHERVSYIPDIDGQGEIAGYFGLVEDITALKLVETQLRQLVRFDGLTGIPNRIQFEEKLEDAIRYSRRYGTLMAILFLDIDLFKNINDSLGHQAGDDVLREFAQRLLACVRDTDTVARLAGDEFVIILEGLTAADEARSVVQKIITAMQRRFDVVGTKVAVTTSVGIAVRREDEEDGQALLRRADEALYRAKAAGRNTFESLL